MILTCPSCTAKYMVPDTAIGAEGRQVRCAKCRHDWYQAPLPEAAPAAVPAAEPASAFAKAMDDVDVEQAVNQPVNPSLDPQRDSPSAVSSANIPAVAKPRRKLPLGWIAAGVILLAGSGSLVFQKSEALADKFPAMAGVYSTLDLPVMLTCKDVGFINERISAVELREGIQRMIRVEGVVRNEGTRDCLVPDIAISIKDTDGGVVKSWTVEHEEDARTIEAGAEMPFAGTTIAPDDPAADVVLEFIPRLR
ncbi:MAG: zinc-ribbon domain-containing protein [Alphaproteobacteria bacterium]